MPDFDLDAAFQAESPPKPVCKVCDQVLRYVDWEGDVAEWQGILFTGHCPACDLDHGLRFRYEVTSHRREGRTLQADSTQQVGSQCPFCGQGTTGFDLCNGDGRRLTLGTDLDATPYFSVDCAQCNSEIHENYTLTGFYSLEDRDVEPDVDRHVLLPDGDGQEMDDHA